MSFVRKTVRDLGHSVRMVVNRGRRNPRTLPDDRGRRVAPRGRGPPTPGPASCATAKQTEPYYRVCGDCCPVLAMDNVLLFNPIPRCAGIVTSSPSTESSHMVRPPGHPRRGISKLGIVRPRSCGESTSGHRQDPVARNPVWPFLSWPCRDPPWPEGRIWERRCADRGG